MYLVTLASPVAIILVVANVVAVAFTSSIELAILAVNAMKRRIPMSTLQAQHNFDHISVTSFLPLDGHRIKPGPGLTVPQIPNATMKQAFPEAHILGSSSSKMVIELQRYLTIIKPLQPAVGFPRQAAVGLTGMGGSWGSQVSRQGCF